LNNTVAYTIHLYVRSRKKYLGLGSERLSLGLGLGPEIEGVGLVSGLKSKVSVSNRNVSFTSLA